MRSKTTHIVSRYKILILISLQDLKNDLWIFFKLESHLNLITFSLVKYDFVMLSI